MTKIIRLAFILSFPLTLLFFSNCHKDVFGNGHLSFSTDTLTFDTVFATLGSTTRYFKVFNKDKKAVKISDIRLLHQEGNQFRVNVDGATGDHFSNVEIPGRDSIYIFVEVTVNPNSASTPYIIVDDVQFTLNGATQDVHVQAFGQNAHFHFGEEILSGQNAVWNNDLPHVVISHDSVPGVLVDCGASLTIHPGCKIFFAGNSALFVAGNLTASASSWSDSIIFRGVRLEQFYDDKPGQWFGIVFLRDSTNTGSCAPTGLFDHCVVNESSYGIYAGAGLSTNLSTYTGAGGRPNVTIQNTIVKNSQNNAVYGFNANITVANSLFFAAGDNLIKFGLGGNYNFTNCTMFNNGSRYVDHQKESLLLSDLVSNGSSILATEPLSATFTNCVVYGSLQNEISFNNSQDTNLTYFQNSFSYSLLKTKTDTFTMFTVLNASNLFNQDPLFKDASQSNFYPSDTAGTFSPLIDYCPSGLSQDIFGTTRPVSKTTNANKFDIGAIEAR